MSAPGQSRRLLPLCLFVLLTPSLAAASHSLTVSSTPAVVARNSTFTFTVTATEPIFGSGTIYVSTNRGDVTVSPASWSLTFGSTTRTVTVTTGNTGGNVVITVRNATSSGDLVATRTSWIQGRASFGIPGNLAFTTHIRSTFGSNVDVPVPAGLSLTFNNMLSGPAAPGSSITPTVGPAESISVTPGAANADLTISATLGGSAAGYYTPPDPRTVQVAGLFGLAGPNNIFVAAGATTTVNVGLIQPNTNVANPVTTPFSVGVSTSGSAAAAATFTPAGLSFAAGDAHKPITVTAGQVLGDIVFSFPEASPYVTGAASPKLIVRGTMSTSNRPASLANGQTSAPIVVSLSHSSPKAFTININVTSGPSGTTVSAASLTFQPGEMSKTFTVTAGSGAGAGISIGWSIVDFINNYFTPPTPFSIQVIQGAPTSVGTDVTVTPPVPSGGQVKVVVNYAEVTAAGSTQLKNVTTPIAPPSGYEIPGAPLYFMLSTTAAVQGPVTVCADYSAATGDPSGFRLFKMTPDGWYNPPSTFQPPSSICATIEAFDPMMWAIFRPNTPPTVGAITGPTGIVMANSLQAFTAQVHDVNDGDELTATWVWSDGTTSAAVITNEGTYGLAHGEHAFANGGTFNVTLVVSDGPNNTVSAPFSVTVDAAPPAIASVTASPESLGTPNSRMIDVVLTVSATDDTGTPVCAISGVTVTSQNPKQAAYVLTGPLSLQLKAFALTSYDVTVTCTDSVGRTTQKSVSVGVTQHKKDK